MNQNNYRTWLSVAVLALLAACNTVEGLGEDIAAGGRAMQRSAERNSR